MIKQKAYLLVCYCIFTFTIHNVWAESKHEPNPLYQQIPPTADSTGKVYMGREIAPVTDFQSVAWLERAGREKEERTDILMRVLNLKQGMVVADIGAGTGFLSRRMANEVGGAGIVYAVDIQPEMIHRLEQLSKKFPNIKPVLSKPDNVKLAANSLDKAIMLDVYHELAFPYEMMQSVWTALKPGAKLVLVEYRAEDDKVPVKNSHKMTQAQIIKEITVLPFKWHNTITSLPWQHMVVFTKN